MFTALCVWTIVSTTVPHGTNLERRMVCHEVEVQLTRQESYFSLRKRLKKEALKNHIEIMKLKDKR
jgi:hypothetical protein